MEISVGDFAEKYNFEVVAGKEGLDNKITCVYIGDLLSWVMAKAPENSAWITIQGHINIVAVTLLTGSSCIIVAEGSVIDKEAIDKANMEDIPLLASKLNAYDIARLFFELEIA